MKFVQIFLLFFIVFVVACEEEEPALPMTHFYEGFDNFNDNGNWVLELQNENRLQIVNAPVRKSKSAAKITIKPGDLVSHGNRAEIKVFPHHAVDTETWLKFSVFIPIDFKESQIAKNSRHMIMQCHEQPPEDMGWTEFKTVSDRNRRPSVAINVTIENGDTYFNLMYGNHRYLANDTIRQHNIGKMKINRAQWYDIKLHVKWSLNDDGFIESWVDNNKWSGIQYAANMTNPTPVTIKFGLYRNKKNEYVNSIYFDEISIQNVPFN